MIARPNTGLTASRDHNRPNRLAGEKSPYLLQHAHNPVNWYPWSEEAFGVARRENRPIFLSVGYSTCHWCHVMAHESFEDEAIAKALNAGFICIKVDREERPDVDALYMQYVQATTGRGGWPMSVWLTPEREPFLGGTYFSRDAFLSLLGEISTAWMHDRARIASAAARAGEFLRTPAHAGASRPDIDDAARRSYDSLAQAYDTELGGFGPAPKFPRPVLFGLLLRYARTFNEPRAADMTLDTLRAIARGGIHDHIGGGFHRYSVDDRWHVPHFEKMLYDQAQLAGAYLEAWQVAGDPVFATTLRGILEYVLRDMTSPEGAFYSAEDADSAVSHAPGAEKKEGAFYVWTKSELDRILGSEDSRRLADAYGILPEGNVAHDPFGEFGQTNILHAAATTDDGLAKVRARLMLARALRPRPHLDDKILTAWNGLMISSLARAARALEESRYLVAARKAARFLLAEVSTDNGRALLRRYRDGEAAIGGFLDDYAFLVQALLDLYEADADIQWITTAQALIERQNDLFWDNASGGYFMTDGTDSTVLARQKDFHDGAEPSANSISALNLVRLARMTGLGEYSSRAEKVFAAAGATIRSAPQAAPQLIAAGLFATGEDQQIVLAGFPDSSHLSAMRTLVARWFLPYTVLLYADGGAGQDYLGRNLPFIRTMKTEKGVATAYVCQDYTCKLPTTDPEELDRLLGDESRRWNATAGQ